ncbi:nucleoside phosphatase family-domain-containing protein [Syncephalis fuscata]|nr:nucleoside phosphatase family-domain-containing protein [Syncephalis fuscata]
MNLFIQLVQASWLASTMLVTPAKASAINYALIIDAGSGGTRIYPYYWQSVTAKNPHVAVNPMFKKGGKQQKAKVAPGLAAQEPAKVAEYLLPLIEKAKKFIPSEYHSNTPIFLKATLVPFNFDSKSGAQIITGEQEGIYGWITTNTLMNTLHATTPLKGAYTTQVNETSYELYAHSYLGLGVGEARKRCTEIQDPCTPNGVTQSFVVNGRTVKLIGRGNFEGCREVVRRTLLGRNSVCAVEPCAINSVYQPDIPADMPVFGTGNYYDIAEQLQCTGKSSMKCIQNAAQKACQSGGNNLKEKNSDDDSDNDESTDSTCFGAALLLGLAVDSYRLPIDREFNFVDQSPAGKFGWTLGAMIEYVESIRP